jgi:hypothetical protein
MQNVEYLLVAFFFLLGTGTEQASPCLMTEHANEAAFGDVSLRVKALASLLPMADG